MLEPAWRGLMERLGVCQTTLGEVVLRTKWASRRETGTTIQDQAPKRGWSFRSVLVSPSAHHNISKLMELESGLEICTCEKMIGSKFLFKFSVCGTSLAAHTSIQRQLQVVSQETDGTSDGVSIATLVWRHWKLCIISKVRIPFCAQVEGNRGDIISTSPMTLQSQYQPVPNESIPTYGHSWPQRHGILLQLETHRATRHAEAAI